MSSSKEVGMIATGDNNAYGFDTEIVPMCQRDHKVKRYLLIASFMGAEFYFSKEKYDYQVLQKLSIRRNGYFDEEMKRLS